MFLHCCPNKCTHMWATAVQGIGGGAIVNLGSIILGDLVSLAERGTYQGLLILTWALAGAIGPSIVSTAISTPMHIRLTLLFRLVRLHKTLRGGGFSVCNHFPCYINASPGSRVRRFEPSLGGNILCSRRSFPSRTDAGRLDDGETGSRRLDVSSILSSSGLL